MVYLTGFADEASQDIDLQIKATKELGWNCIESRVANGKNIHNLSDEEFEVVYEKLQSSGVKINCFGSAIANWGKDIRSDVDPSFDEATRAIKRMKRLGTKLIRIMSYAVIPDAQPSEQMFEKRVERLKRIVGDFRDNDLIPVHENCMNYGGMGASYTLELIDRVPGLKLVFDTGNPIFTVDRDMRSQEVMQKSYQFYDSVKEHVAYVHIKDGFFDHEKKKAIYSFPGEGHGDVVAIVVDLVKNGYKGGFSMEPHMATVFHDENGKRDESECYRNYVEYGKRFMSILDQNKIKYN